MSCNGINSLVDTLYSYERKREGERKKWRENSRCEREENILLLLLLIHIYLNYYFCGYYCIRSRNYLYIFFVRLFCFRENGWVLRETRVRFQTNMVDKACMRVCV
jgi:hypothetical protein